MKYMLAPVWDNIEQWCYFVEAILRLDLSDDLQGILSSV